MSVKAMFRHLDRHSNEVMFIRCKDRACCAEWQSSELRDQKRKKKWSKIWR